MAGLLSRVTYIKMECDLPALRLVHTKNDNYIHAIIFTPLCSNIVFVISCMLELVAHNKYASFIR